MDIQQLELNANVRIKFASINQFGNLLSDAGQEYIDLFSKFPKDWKYEERPAGINEHAQWIHRSWIMSFKDHKTEIGAVEHETGIEILIEITSGLAVEAILHFTKWAWNTWKASRASDKNKIEPSLVLETVTERSALGDFRESKRIEIKGHLTGDDVVKHIEAALKAQSK